MPKRLLAFSVVFFQFAVASSVSANSLVTKLARETIEFAAKKFSRTLSKPAAQKLESTLVKAAAQHGDDVFRAVRSGGIELIEQGGKHGDELWRLAVKHPNAARSLALHGDELLPLVRKMGPDVLKLETRSPRLGLRAASLLGDRSVGVLVKAPEEHVPMIMGYAQKTSDPKVRKLLVDAYEKSSDKSAFLKAFNWKTIMVSGLSASAIIYAYQISDGKQEGLKELAKNNPEAFAAYIKQDPSRLERSWNFLTSSLGVAIGLLGLIPLALVGYGLFLVGRWIWCKNRENPSSSVAAEKSVTPPKE